jgi:hypothetical protein
LCVKEDDALLIEIVVDEPILPEPPEKPLALGIVDKLCE